MINLKDILFAAILITQAVSNYINSENMRATLNELRASLETNQKIIGTLNNQLHSQALDQAAKQSEYVSAMSQIVERNQYNSILYDPTFQKIMLCSALFLLGYATLSLTNVYLFKPLAHSLSSRATDDTGKFTSSSDALLRPVIMRIEKDTDVSTYHFGHGSDMSEAISGVDGSILGTSILTTSSNMSEAISGVDGSILGTSVPSLSSALINCSPHGNLIYCKIPKYVAFEDMFPSS